MPKTPNIYSSEQYAVDAGGVLSADVYKQAVGLCDEVNFALIKQAISADRVAACQDLAIACMGFAAKRGLVEFEEGEKEQYAAIPFTSSVSERFEELEELALDTSRLTAAGAMQPPRSRRMALAGQAKLSRLQLNVYGPGHNIAPHWDDDEGVAVVCSLVGIGRMVVGAYQKDTKRVCKLAQFNLEPGDVVIMPAQIEGRGGSKDHAWHSVTNVTPQDEQNPGLRLSLAAIYTSKY